MRRCDHCGEVRCICLALLRRQVDRLMVRPIMITPETVGPDDVLLVVVPTHTSRDAAQEMVDIAKSKGVRLLAVAAESVVLIKGAVS